ncbi:hypothetical protein PGT21_050296 [Puccinia graminis f. sp. tritici]|uniref:Tc1-like transposase DDE domain-containing protein n=1 Tax=Puccinia graminis f. sp. tritici TaxID=56615 RepID=A0A5B0MZ73_PUCGR|nr:hypothetical protein PGT21_050296 [Puccinia graminis f. sp. tritici]
MYRLYEGSLKFMAVKSYLEGLSLDEINLRYGLEISADSLRQWSRLYETTQSVVSDPATHATRGRPLALTNEQSDFVAQLVTNNPLMYLAEIQQELLIQFNAAVSLQTISRLDLSWKKLRKVNPNQDPDQQAAYVTLMAHIDPACLVFTDECGICLDGVVRTMGWAPTGQRTPRVEREQATRCFNLIPGVALLGLVACAVLEENVDRFHFEYYLEYILLPSMNPFPGPQRVLVMDNASWHHNGRIAELIEARGCRLFYLPPYSPDLNPIEKGFSVLKARLRCYSNLTGGEEDAEQIEIYAQLVFTAELMVSLF